MWFTVSIGKREPEQVNNIETIMCSLLAIPKMFGIKLHKILHSINHFLVQVPFL